MGGRAVTSATYTATEQPAAKRFRRAMDRSERVDDALGDIIDLLSDHPRLEGDQARRLELMLLVRSLDRRGR